MCVCVDERGREREKREEFVITKDRRCKALAQKKEVDPLGVKSVSPP